METVPVPVLDSSNKIQLYTQLKIDKPDIVLNDETYIFIHCQELNTCKSIGYEYFCEGLFVVNSKHKYSCASTVYFNSNYDIKENCDFYPLSQLVRCNTICVRWRKANDSCNWPNYKRIICTYKNNILVNMPSHLSIL